MEQQILLDQLKQYIQSNKRVCPMPQRWNELYELLPDTHRVGNGYEPSAPLILAAWHETSDKEKRARLLIHIDYAAKKGAIEKIDAFIRKLPEQEWAHGGEA